MAYEYTPPKYAQVIEELQRRIENGEYAPGSLLPSEHQLSAEFAIARPTVVRALRVLRDNGWIETQQGKGSFVRGRPALAGLVGTSAGENLVCRRRLVRQDGEPSELVTWWFRPEVAEETGLVEAALLAGGVRDHLAR